MKTRCYYTEYVNHMIRFYITCPDSVRTDGKRQSDIANWVAVQSALRSIPESDKEKVMTIYRTHYNLPKAVEMYCEKTGADAEGIWVLLTKVASLVARRRGLV